MKTKNKKWNNLHKFYSKQDWIDKPNIFAEEVLEFLPKKGKILCLGDGQGQDGRFFATKGHEVLSTDISEDAMSLNKEKIETSSIKNITVDKLDLTKKFNFKNESFDVVYAHLSIHYFSEKITKQIFNEIYRVLKKNGIAAIFVNSVNDPEFNLGKRLEQELFDIDGYVKRFFSVYSMRYFARDFEVLLLDDEGRTYKDDAKGVRNLVRFVGKKK